LITIPAAILNQLQYENQFLKQEKAVLKQEAIGLSARIDYIKKWESSQATHKENEKFKERKSRTSR
jgi:hypothetical protein